MKIKLTWGVRALDCENTDDIQTSRVTSYLSTNLLVSVLTWLITLEQIVDTVPL